MAFRVASHPMRLALHAQEAVLEASALQVRLELLLYVFGQRPAGGLTLGEQLRVVLLDELEEEGLLGLMSPVSTFV